VFLTNTFSSIAQTSQSLQAGIISYAPNDRFCKGLPESFPLEATASGGTEPYYYEWTFTWRTDTLHDKTISVQPPTGGEVKLKVTDSSRPPKSKEDKYQIYEIALNADFTFDPDNACAQTPIRFTPVISGGTPELKYFWDFGDRNTSTLKNPVHEFIASGCSGNATFNVKMVVSDADGCSATVSKTVTVKRKPYLNFEDSENPFSPFKHCPEIIIDPKFDVVLQNRSQDVSCISSYKIDWGDGTVDNAATFPKRHTYTKTGAFKLVITAENTSGCTLVWTHYVYNQSSPAAGIESYGGTEGCAPVEFSFRLVGYENNSIGTTYTWNFGDGTPKIEWDHEDPFKNDTIKHLYERTSCYGSPGYFSTYVTVANGCDTKTATVDKIRIWSKPEANIADEDLTIDTICVNEAIQLDNSTISGNYGNNCNKLTQYLWDFGNGITSTAEKMPLVSWSAPGVYNISLKASNPCGETSDNFQIVVIEPPVADALIDKTSGCAPFKPKFKNNSKGHKDYLWEIMPDSGYTYINGTSGKSWEPEISFNLGGSYTVILYVSNSCQTDSVIFNLNVFSVPDGSIKNLNDICITDPVIHPLADYDDNGSPVKSFNWTFTGASPPAASAADPGEHRYTAPGEYTVNLVMENECGIRNLAESFHIHPSPKVTVNTPVSVCESQSLIIAGTTITNVTSVKWQTLGDGHFSNDTLLNPVYNPGSNDLVNSGTSLRIIVQGESPCNADSAVIKVNIQKKPLVKVDEDVTVCEGNEYKMTSTKAENYEFLKWSTSGDGHFSDPAILLPVYYPGDNDISRGSVKLSLTAHAKEPCSINASDSLVITYARIPTLNAGPDRDICKDGQVSLSASGSGFTTVQWRVETLNGSLDDPSGLTPVFKLNPGVSDSLAILTVKASGGFGCPDVYDTLKLKIIPYPVVFAGRDTIVCEAGSIEIRGASVKDYLDFSWSLNGDGTLSDSTVLNPVYNPGSADIANGFVSLTLIAEGKSVCPDVTDEISVSIQKVPAAFAGDDQEVCKTNNYTITGSQLNGSSHQWITSGSGTFQDESKLTTIYYPSEADKDSGRVELVLKVNPVAPCSSPDYDTVMFIFIDPPVISAGNDTTICSSSFIPVNAYSHNSTQYEWSSSGSGTWKDANTLTPTYYPSTSDIITGSVVLTLTSKNAACPTVSDNMILKLTPFPVSEAGPDDVICEDQGKSLNGSSSSNYSSLEWKTSGDGKFNDNTITHPAYYPGIKDINNGSVKLYLIANGKSPCNTTAIDSLTLSIQKNPFVYAGPDTLIGERESFTTVNATAQNVNQLSWSTMGDGTFINGSDIISTYIHGDNDLKNEGVNLIIRGTSNSPCVKAAADTVHILITPKPSADAGADEKICEGSGITVSTASAEKYSEIWWTTTGTGVLENETTLNPTYHPGDEDIANRKVLLVLHARGKDPIEEFVVSDTMAVSIIHNVFADVIFSDTACVNSSYQIRDVVYKDVNIISWSSSGNGHFSGTGEEYPVYSFSEDDTRKDSLYFYLQVTSIAPCIQIVRDTMMIRLFHEPEPSFDYDNPEGCSPLNVNFTNTSAGEELTSFWDFGNGLTSSDKDPVNIIFRQGKIADTTYNVTLTTKNRCSSPSANKIVTVKPVPVADFGMDVPWGCSPKEILFFNVTTGLPDTFTWNWGDGKDQSFEENPGSHIFETGITDTTYTITLTAGNECGMDSIQKSVIIFPNKVKAFFEADTVLGCAPLEVSFTNYSRGVLGNRPFLNWSWNFGDGNVSDELNPVHLFEKPGKYTVTLYVNDTCSFDSFTTQIDAMGAPDVDFVTDKAEYCQFDTVFVTPVNLQVSQTANVAWDFGDATQGYNFKDQHVYETAGVYNIILTAKDIINGCAASTSREIKIHPEPVAEFEIIPDYDGNPLQVAFLNKTTEGDFFTWDFGDGNVSTEKDPWHGYEDYGTFNVILTADNKYNCRSTIIKSVELESYKGLWLPNAISPGNASEGVREFKAVGAGLREFHLVIYDTWGNLIWETTKLENGVPVEAWDGTFKGKPLPVDAYVWHLKKAIFTDGKIYEGPVYGSITLIK